MFDRRAFLKRTGAAGLVLAPSLKGLALAGSVGIDSGSAGYGPLAPSPEVPYLAVPRGFHAAVLCQAMEPLSNGQPCPNAYDGMAAFAMGGDTVRLVRNHEIRDRVPVGRPLNPDRSYDDQAMGGTTTVEVTVAPDGQPTRVADWVSLSGTLVNCAGGHTPWGSWLSCEETVVARSDRDGNPTGLSQNHGYVFEVPAAAVEAVDPSPLGGLGRMVHEAVGVDPASGIVYLTEDQDPSGFYRFIPRRPGRLAEGGQLQMLAVRSRPRFDTRSNQPRQAHYRVGWVPITDPDPSSDYIEPDALYRQGFRRGGARFARLEGCFCADGGAYFTATSGGNVGAGQVWYYRPTGGNTGELTLVFESPDGELLNSPDNVCVSPRGGVLLCEDNGGKNHLRGIDPEGRIFDFARNDRDSLEFAGATFSPQGRTLFVNIQGALWIGDGTEPRGVTLAIWGPWEQGPL